MLLKGEFQGNIGGAIDEVCEDFLGIRNSGMRVYIEPFLNANKLARCEELRDSIARIIVAL